MSEVERQEIEEIRQEADAAEALLRSPVFNKAFESMNQTIVDEFLRSPPEAMAERERLYAKFQAGQLFVQQFAALINNLELRKQREGD